MIKRGESLPLEQLGGKHNFTSIDVNTIVGAKIKDPFYLAEAPLTFKKVVEASFIGGVFVTVVIGLLGTFFTILGNTALMLVYLATILAFLLASPIFFVTFMFR